MTQRNNMLRFQEDMELRVGSIPFVCTFAIPLDRNSSKNDSNDFK